VEPKYRQWIYAVCLVAFGVAWLTASHVVPGINHPSERHHLTGNKRGQSGHH
jgi:hypothetical protein